MAKYFRHSSFLALPLLFTLAAPLSAADDPIVFKSDVAMTRVDAQVVDRDGRAITGLNVRDFVLRLDGKVLPIRNFASEDMPIDILLLLDVSGSMEPHVERIAAAARDALNVLADKDRVAIMIFDTYTRVRLPFRNSHTEVTGELNRLIRSESFNGGTRITRAMLDAANYLQKEARPDARRAIVILTDDQTQDEENESRVEASLARANAVLSFLQAPYEPPTMHGGGGGGGGRPRGTWGGGGGGWPGGGTGWPGGGGGIGFPGGGPSIGRGRPGGYGVDPSHTAGTADIARDSGGDTMRVDEASALEDTLARLRQRYALYFYLPEGAKASDQQSLRIDLAEQTRIRFQESQIHYRRVYMAGSGSSEHTGPVINRVQERVNTDTPKSPTLRDESSQDNTTPKRRRAAVNDESGAPRINTVDAEPADESAPSQTPSTAKAPQTGGWPRVSDPKPPPQ